MASSSSTTKGNPGGAMSFEEFANEILSRPGAQEQIEANKRNAPKFNLLNLKYALSDNTAPRVRGIMKDVLGLTYPPEMNKEEVIKESIKHIVSLAEVPEDMEWWAADLAIVHTDDKELRKGEIVILRVNERESVYPCEYMLGWILREVETNGKKEKQYVFCDSICLRHISCGWLVRKRKEPTIYSPKEQW